MMDHSVGSNPLSGLSSLDGLSGTDVLNLPVDRLQALARSRRSYNSFTRITGGKNRAVTEPLGDLEKVHDRLFELLNRINKPDYLHSGVKGRSHISHAGAHRGKKPLVTIDILKFFASVSTKKVERFFGRQMACAAPVADLLARLCTYRGHLPIGSRVSQPLAYFASRPMLEDLSRLSMQHDVLFTCYVDDLCFSGNEATPRFLWRVKQLIHHHGFGYHRAHCYKADEPKTVTGVLVHGDKLSVLPQHALQIQQDQRELEHLEPAYRSETLARLIGRVAAAADIEPERSCLLQQLLAMRVHQELAAR